jgi:hypothetical protein
VRASPKLPIPGVEARLLDHDGHLTLLQNRVREVHAWLTGRLWHDMDGGCAACHAHGVRRALGVLGPGLPFLAFLAVLYGGQWLLGIRIPPHQSTSAEIAFGAVLLVAFVAGSVFHELGHAAAVRVAGERVLGIQIGGKVASVTFRLGQVPVSVGIGLLGGGSVTYHSYRVSAPRRALVIAAGPAANVLAALCCLALPVPRWEASYLALAVLASAVSDLAPARTGNVHTSDGFKLLRFAAERRAAAEVRALLADPDWPDHADAHVILIDGFRLDVPEAEDCLHELSHQPDVLLRVFRKPWPLPDRPEPDVTHLVHVLSWKVLAFGNPSADAADLAASRLEWVLDHLDKEHPDQRTPPHEVRYAIGLARLRQQRPQEVQALCADALAADLDTDDRATVLAMVAMARHALLLSGRPQLDQAIALDPDAVLVSEAVRLLDGGWDSALAAYDQRVRPRGQ